MVIVARTIDSSLSYHQKLFLLIHNHINLTLQSANPPMHFSSKVACDEELQ
jgi:hypothetical protein